MVNPRNPPTLTRDDLYVVIIVCYCYREQRPQLGSVVCVEQLLVAVPPGRVPGPAQGVPGRRGEHGRGDQALHRARQEGQRRHQAVRVQQVWRIVVLIVSNKQINFFFHNMYFN